MLMQSLTITPRKVIAVCAFSVRLGARKTLFYTLCVPTHTSGFGRRPHLKQLTVSNRSREWEPMLDRDRCGA